MGPLPSLLLDLVLRNAQLKLEDDLKDPSSSKSKERMVRDRKFVEMACFLIMECDFDSNYVRKTDCYTPLHIAAQAGLLYMCSALPEMEADVNAVALDDAMPLALARKSGSDKCAAVLKAKGAKETWRMDKLTRADAFMNQLQQGRTETDKIGTETMQQAKNKKARGKVMFTMSASITANNGSEETGEEKEEEEEEVIFEASEKFEGTREGMAFKKGDQGVGYYGSKKKKAAEKEEEEEEEEEGFKPGRYDFSCGE